MFNKEKLKKIVIRIGEVSACIAIILFAAFVIYGL